ncbi:hypothetical protein NDU88_005131 [Pleurodeles waltl]|uniref:Uncharacterized protein n=1 Tax=Pleurodeles waltl TaxID=8319 RepID=A0AAV7SKS3_PLEWA|nr:hypothetical protein NDU88_005131 [Pleurodeles waltl]
MGRSKPKEGGTTMKTQGAIRMERPPLGYSTEPLAPALQLMLDKILVAIVYYNQTFQLQFGEVSTQLGLLKEDHQKLVDKVQAVEVIVSELQPVQNSLQQKMSNLAERVKILEHRTEHAEGHTQLNNIRIMRLFKVVKDRDMITFANIGRKQKWHPLTFIPSSP